MLPSDFQPPLVPVIFPFVAWIVIKYSGVHIHVIPESSSIVNAETVPVPEEGTLPVPVHPVLAWRTPLLSFAGLGTEFVMILPAEGVKGFLQPVSRGPVKRVALSQRPNTDGIGTDCIDADGFRGISGHGTTTGRQTGDVNA